MKLKDKTTADIVASWYSIENRQPGDIYDSLGALRRAMFALDEPDLPEELREWQEATRDVAKALNSTSESPLIAWIETVRGSPLGLRYIRANRALLRSCQEGVTT